MIATFAYDMLRNIAIQRVMGSHAPLTHVNKVKIALILLGALFFLAALGFTLTGFYLYLISIMELPYAMMIFGATLLGVSALCIALFMYMQAKREEKMRKMKEEIKEDINAVIEKLQVDFSPEDFYRDHPTACIVTAALAGAFTGDKMAAA